MRMALSQRSQDETSTWGRWRVEEAASICLHSQRWLPSFSLSRFQPALYATSNDPDSDTRTFQSQNINRGLVFGGFFRNRTQSVCMAGCWLFCIQCVPEGWNVLSSKLEPDFCIWSHLPKHLCRFLDMGWDFIRQRNGGMWKASKVSIR